MEKIILSFDNFKKEKTVTIKDKIFDCELDSDIIKSFNIKFSVEANKYDDLVVANFKVYGYFELECSRCLELYKHNIAISFESSFDSQQYEIDVVELVRENVILNIPMQPLCKKDCKGICQVCGKNKNISDCSCDKEKENREFIAQKWSNIKKIK